MILTNLLITAYCSCTICCGSHAKNITASGRKPIQGITLAASRSIPLGTRIHIDGMTNDFIVQDRYKKGLSDRIDVFFNDHQAAKTFGKQHHNIKVILP